MAKTPEQEIRKAFRKHTDFVKDYLVLLGDAMRQPDSVARGKRIAELANKLEFANDSARRFALDLDFNGKPLKRATPGE